MEKVMASKGKAENMTKAVTIAETPTNKPENRVKAGLTMKTNIKSEAGATQKKAMANVSANIEKGRWS